MNSKCLYDNPAITAPCFPFVQLDAVEEQQDGGRSVTIIRFRVQPLFPDFGGEYLYSVLHQLPTVKRIWQRCRKTFGFSGFDAKSAIGRWAKVYLVPSKWPRSNPMCMYSTVQYVRQTHIDGMQIAELERLTKLNAVPWDASDMEEAAAMIEAATCKRHGDVYVQAS